MAGDRLLLPMWDTGTQISFLPCQLTVSLHSAPVLSYIVTQHVPKFLVIITLIYVGGSDELIHIPTELGCLFDGHKCMSGQFFIIIRDLWGSSMLHD